MGIRLRYEITLPLAIVAAFSAVLAFGRDWNFQYPPAGQDYLTTSNISAAGDASDVNLGYTLEFVDDYGGENEVVVQSTSGTSMGPSQGMANWAASLSPPSGGWPTGLNKTLVLSWVYGTPAGPALRNIDIVSF